MSHRIVQIRLCCDLSIESRRSVVGRWDSSRGAAFTFSSLLAEKIILVITLVRVFLHLPSSALFHLRVCFCAYAFVLFSFFLFLFSFLFFLLFSFFKFIRIPNLFSRLRFHFNEEFISATVKIDWLMVALFLRYFDRIHTSYAYIHTYFSLYNST